MRVRMIIGLAAVVGLMATTASAGHDLAVTFDLVDNSAGANSDATASVDYGDKHPDSGATHIEGIEIAHEDGSGLTPEPDDGDVVAEFRATANWKVFFCGRSTQTFDGTWVSPMDTPPSGIEDADNEVVAQIEVDAVASIIDVWVVKSTETHGDVGGSVHYDLVVTDFGDDACSGSDVEVDVTTYGTVAGSSPTRIVSENPGTGTYDVLVEYTDKDGNPHSATDTFTIS